MQNNSAIEIEQCAKVLKVSAPSNIALIKYMGLKNTEEKIPANPSISYTLEDKRTTITIEVAKENNITSEFGQERFLSFLEKLQTEFCVTEKMQITSKNNFPTGCGLASSASSFAALTAGVAQFSKSVSFAEMTKFSRIGSGSACRSFIKGFVEWSEDIKPVKSAYKKLYHCVLLLDRSHKKISSSQAHKLVKTSPWFSERVINAKKRAAILKQALELGNWIDAKNIIEDDYQEMHALFESSNPAFHYKSPKVFELETWLKDYSSCSNVHPWVTMDAGPNIHLLFFDEKAKLDCIQQIKIAFKDLEII